MAIPSTIPPVHRDNPATASMPVTIAAHGRQRGPRDAMPTLNSKTPTAAAQQPPDHTPRAQPPPQPHGPPPHEPPPHEPPGGIAGRRTAHHRAARRTHSLRHRLPAGRPLSRPARRLVIAGHRPSRTASVWTRSTTARPPCRPGVSHAHGSADPIAPAAPAPAPVGAVPARTPAGCPARCSWIAWCERRTPPTKPGRPRCRLGLRLMMAEGRGSTPGVRGAVPAMTEGRQPYSYRSPAAGTARLDGMKPVLGLTDVTPGYSMNHSG
jgi:hypothetical protein